MSVHWGHTTVQTSASTQSVGSGASVEPGTNWQWTGAPAQVGTSDTDAHAYISCPVSLRREMAKLLLLRDIGISPARISISRCFCL